MNINSVFILTTLHTAIKLLSGIVINKIFAVYLGSSGLAVVGQLQNFISLAINVASGSIHTGLVKYTAEYSSDKCRQRKVWVNGFFLTLVLTVPTIVLMLLFSGILSRWILFSSEYSGLFSLLAITFVFQVLYMFILSVLNGLQDIKLYIVANIVISLLTMAIIVGMSIEFGLDGALYAIILSQLVVFLFVAIAVYSKYGLEFFAFDKSKNGDDYELMKKLLQFGAVSFVSGIALSLTQILVRSIIVHTSGLEIAGFWEALMRISTYFTMVFLLPAGIYYLPKFAELVSLAEIKSTFLKSLLFFMPLALLGAGIFWMFKEFFIELLLSEKFLIIAPLISLMLMGDIFRILAYLIVNLMFAKKFLLRLIMMDLIYGSAFVVLAYVFFSDNGLISLGYIYLFCNILIFLYTLHFYLRMNSLMEKKGA